MEPGTAPVEPFPPWGEKQAWDTACRAVRHLRQRHSWRGTRTADLALAVRGHLRTLEGVMEHLCDNTCRFCPSPCCLSAKPFFDLTDLLVMVFNDIPLPPYQTLQRQQSVCRYAGPKGCRLERNQRPWICTWYLCPDQKSRLAQESDIPQKTVSSLLPAIGQMRREVEKTFIRKTCGTGATLPCRKGR